MTRTLSIRSRRAAVIALYGGYAVFAVLWHFRYVHSVGLAVVALCALALTGVAGMWLFRGTAYWNWGNAPDKDLDERETRSGISATGKRTARSSPSRFWRLCMPISLRTLAAGCLTGSGMVRRFCGCTLLVGLTLPSALLAWNDRTPVGED